MRETGIPQEVQREGEKEQLLSELKKEMKAIETIYSQVRSFDEQYKAGVPLEEILEAIDTQIPVSHDNEHTLIELPPSEIISQIYGKEIEHDTKNKQTSIMLYFSFFREEQREQDWEAFVQNWDAYYLIIQDFAARAKGYLEGTTDIDPAYIQDADMFTLLSAVQKTTSDSAEKHAVDITYDIDVPPEATAHIAPGVFFNKLENTISNPLRKTRSIDATQVVCTARIESSGDDTVLVVRVEDDGVGMSDEVLSHIFDSGFTKTEGKGVGIADMDALCQQMGIAVRVESTPRQGSNRVFPQTIFTFTIPLVA